MVRVLYVMRDVPLLDRFWNDPIWHFVCRLTCFRRLQQLQSAGAKLLRWHRPTQRKRGEPSFQGVYYLTSRANPDGAKQVEIGRVTQFLNIARRGRPTAAQDVGLTRGAATQLNSVSLPHGCITNRSRSRQDFFLDTVNCSGRRVPLFCAFALASGC